MLCVIPALRALRHALPNAEIVLIGLPTIEPLMQRFGGYIDQVLAFPGYPGLPERSPDLRQIPDFLKTVQSYNFDLALQMHGSGGITNPLITLFGAKQTAGFWLPGSYCPDRDRFLPYQEQESEIRRYLNLLKFLGIPAQDEALEFPIFDSDWEALNAIAGISQLQPNYVCVHPGASVPERRWPPDRFAAVADSLAARGFQVVLTGSAAEISLTQTVAQMMQAPCLNLAGQTNLGSLAVLLKRSRLLVCNDTGVSHLAAALQTPSVVLFPNSNPTRWAPLNRDRHRVISQETGLSTTIAIAQAQELLQQEGAYVA